MRKAVSIGLAVALALLVSTGADGARVKLGNLVLSAEGGFTPQKLPRRAFAPIAFQGHFDITETDGSIPPALQQVVVEFDRDGRLETTGLPTCDPSQVQEATPEEARATCGPAIVGTGHLRLLIERASGPPYDVEVPLTLFNGPPQGGNPTVLLHTRTTVPATQNFAITVPIERRRGAFRYRATIDLPPIDLGRGSLVHFDARIDRRWRFGGRERSYVSARCSDNVLDTRGRFTFADGVVIEGSVEKACIFR